MPRFSSVGLFFAAVKAHRIDLGDALATDEFSDLSGHLNLQENSTLNKICYEERFWPPALAKKFPNGKMVGSGATACVAIADNSKGVKVAIKIGKKGSNLDEWVEECNKLKKIRLDSCKNKVLDLHQQYVPTCTDVGQVSFKGEKINYYVMHAAAVSGISQIGKGYTPDLATRKMIGAEVVTAIYAFHKAGYAHNDLHGNNVVVNQKTGALQLIDLGDAANYPGWIKDYKRDSNAVWRWLAIAADCPNDAQWFSHLKGVSTLTSQADRFKNCIEEKWNPGNDFMKALGTMLNGCIKNLRVHNVDKLYNTQFVKNNAPKLQNLFPEDFTKGCQSWSTDVWQTKELQSEFAGHYKCDQIPTYQSSGTGKKKKSTVQCARGRPHASGGQGHCFSMKAGVSWGCAGAIDWDGFKAGNKPCKEMGAPGGGYYDGGCLTKEHPGYRVTKNGTP